LQKSQLHHDEKQKEAYRTDGNEKVLQHLPQANGTQRSEMIGQVLVIGFTLRPQKSRPQGESPEAGDSGESSNG
jgi:hypothetical protein